MFYNIDTRTPFDDNQLIELVTRFGQKNWRSVAAAMHSKKNRFLCLLFKTFDEVEDKSLALLYSVTPCLWIVLLKISDEVFSMG
jgi:hypothetical protein